MKLESKMTKGVGIRNARYNTNGFPDWFTGRNGCGVGRKTKEKPEHGKVLAIFVVAMLLLSVVAVLTWQSTSASVIKINAGPKMEIKYTPRWPIYIKGNANFTSANGVIGGSGTQNDPYIIAGWEIDANGGPYGIWIENTDAYFVIRNCNVYGATGSGSAPYGAGIALNNVTHGTLDSNKCDNSNNGIYLYGGSQYNTIKSNNVSENSESGISLSSSGYNNITNNSVFHNGNGISIHLSICNSITNNNVSCNSMRGIYLSSANHTTIINNNASLNTFGIYLSSLSNYNTITNNNVFGNVQYGITLFSSSTNYINNNKATNTHNTGIYLYSSSDNYITDNNASGNNHGIYLDSSSNNYITNNNASGNYGIYLYSSSHNYITENNASGNANSIYLHSSSNTSITNNILGKNGIVIRGANLEHWNTHDIGTSNLVNEKPVYYYKNQQGGTVSADAGQVILANCSNMVVSGLSISNASIAIQVGFSNYNTIRNNNVSGNYHGIYLSSSSNNNITNNNASANSYGIYLDSSSNNTITNNNVSGNSYCGIYLYSSSNNTITNNNASRNHYGIYLYSSSNNNINYNWICNNTKYGVYITFCSSGNYIHHNCFIGNNGAGKGVNGNCQAYDDVGGNSWYDTTTQEGNYWSNWDGQGWGTANAYPIAGGAGASDWYPLGNPVAEFNSMPLFVLALASLLILARVRKPHKHS